MIRRVHQRVFCILPATPTLKFTRIYNILPLPLNTTDLCFRFRNVFEETEDGKLCSTGIACTEPLIKNESHQLVKKFPTTCGTEKFITVFTTVPSDPCPESFESSPNLHISLLRYVSILYSLSRFQAYLLVSKTKFYTRDFRLLPRSR
jgi:hypothetical protein